jgi:hypothetical protein
MMVASEITCHEPENAAVCNLKERCTRAPFRRIVRDINEDARDYPRSLKGTPEFERSRNERKKVEMLSAGQDMPAGGSWHMVWAKAGDHSSSAKAASGRSVAVIRSPCPGRQSFAADKPRIKIAFEAFRRLAFNHD